MSDRIEVVSRIRDLCGIGKNVKAAVDLMPEASMARVRFGATQMTCEMVAMIAEQAWVAGAHAGRSAVSVYVHLTPDQVRKWIEDTRETKRRVKELEERRKAVLDAVRQNVVWSIRWDRGKMRIEGELDAADCLSIGRIQGVKRIAPTSAYWTVVEWEESAR